MILLKLFISFILSFILSVLLMGIFYYIHIVIENFQVDTDKLGQVYSKKVGPTIWFITFIILYFI